MKRRYFVSYVITDQRSGAHTFGNGDCLQDEPLVSWSEVQALEEVLERRYPAGTSVIILNWRAFEEEA